MAAGYYLVASDGGVFSYGDAVFYGSTGSIHLNQPVVGMAVVPGGGGYWLVASDGGIFSYGDATFYGSTGSMHLNQPVVGMAATPSGHGYWLVAADGGIFSYGDASFHGSTGSLVLNKPIVGMITGPAGAGYFLVASDGGIFSFGTAPFYGSLGGLPIKNPIVAAAVTPTGNGYWFTDSAGLVSNFGSADYYGSAPSNLFRPIVGMAEAPGALAPSSARRIPPAPTATTSATYQCNSLPGGVHQIGIVQVDGELLGDHQPLPGRGAPVGRQRAQPLHLPDLRTSATTSPGVTATVSCNAGYQAGIYAYNDAFNAGGGSTAMPWWLDVETADANWSGNLERERPVRAGSAQRTARDRGHRRCRHLRQPGRLEQHRRQLPTQSCPTGWPTTYRSPSGPGSCADYSNWVAAGASLPGPPQIVQYDSGPVAGSPATTTTTTPASAPDPAAACATSGARPFANADLNTLHAEGFTHTVRDIDWRSQVERHSLGWVCAFEATRLIGFVNVAWDGGVHAFVIDTVVAGDRRHAGIGRGLLDVAERESRAAGCEWLHVDFEEDLRAFYLGACGFTTTPAGLIALR